MKKLIIFAQNVRKQIINDTVYGIMRVCPLKIGYENLFNILAAIFMHSCIVRFYLKM